MSLICEDLKKWLIDIIIVHRIVLRLRSQNIIYSY